MPSSTALKSSKTSSAAALLFVGLDESQFFLFQHANEDVEKMILGNKNDMEEKRVVSRERGEAVSTVTEGVVSGGSSEYCNSEFVQDNSFTVRLRRLTIVTFTVFSLCIHIVCNGRILQRVLLKCLEKFPSAFNLLRFSCRELQLKSVSAQ